MSVKQIVREQERDDLKPYPSSNVSQTLFDQAIVRINQKNYRKKQNVHIDGDQFHATPGVTSNLRVVPAGSVLTYRNAPGRAKKTLLTLASNGLRLVICDDLGRMHLQCCVCETAVYVLSFSSKRKHKC